MQQTDLLKQAVAESAQRWPQLAGPGDPNTTDVYWLARELHDRLRIKLPTELPEKETGVEIVESVEHDLICGSLIRQCQPQVLSERSRRVVETIDEQNLLAFRPVENFVAALYTWHGCINMAKCLRKTYVVRGGEAPYSNHIRQQGYDYLARCWRVEDARGNPWVRYGVSVARLLEHKRGNVVVDNWVPKESPYWQ